MSQASPVVVPRVRRSQHRDPSPGARSPPVDNAGDGLWLSHEHPLHLVDRVVSDCIREAAARSLLDSLVHRHDAPAPERLLRGLLLQMLYSIDSDQRLIEQLHYDLRFRWFTGLSLGAPVWSCADQRALRERLLATGNGRELLDALLRKLRPIAQTWPAQFKFDQHFCADWQQAPGLRSAAAAIPDPRRLELLRSAGLPDDAGSIDARLLRVLEAILTRICARDLNGDRLAASVGMSRRALFYLFDAHGLTPAAAIRNMRLDHCRRLLEDVRHSQRKITAIALDHGFGNVSTFSRSFKQRYGFGPRQCRIDHLLEPRLASDG